MTEIIDFATRRRGTAALCRHQHITTAGEEVFCADCRRALDPASAVRYLAALLARQTAARIAAQRRARQLAGALRQARTALAPRQPDLVCHETGRAALAAVREILK